MKKITKMAALFLVLLMLINLCAAPLATQVYAAPAASKVYTEATGYTAASDVEYLSHTGSYYDPEAKKNVTKTILANWGARGEDCVFLSTYAENYYTGDYQWNALSALQGGTGSADAYSSDLYLELQELMTSTHTYYTEYTNSKNVRDFYAYTDCVSNDISKVALLYRCTLVSSTWDSGTTWNQEHVWPQSRLNTTYQIGDLMHLRAANPSENSSRGNKAFGESSGYYNPGPSVRGDCARTVLYMYVRWGLTGNMWGSEGVMENVDILLEWMEEDPVDTWEMGRNDAVQSVTGVRNVFVDYPELAWLLFGQQVPEAMTTPSGQDDAGSDNAGLLGDANGDGMINTTDAKLIMQYELHIVDGTALNLEALDVNGDGEINTTDAKLVMQLELGIISGFGGDSDAEQPEEVEDTDGMELTVAEAITRCEKAGSAGTAIKYTITGTVTEVVNPTYGNFYIEDDTGSLYIYGCYSADGETRYDAMDNYPQVGDTVTVYGVLLLYTNADGEAIPEMKNAWCLSGGTGKRGVNDSTGPIDGVPQVGVAYKFGMVQENVSSSNVYYLAGGMDGYYMATTTDVSAAIDLYLEEAEGGYYLYTMEGDSKVYINMVVSGTYVNGAYESAAATVYTWDTDAETLVATVNGALYWFGTRNDRSYTTVGPCKTSYEGFYCMFYEP